MNVAAVADSGPSLMLIEGGLTLIAVAVSFCWPRLGAPFFARVEDVFARLARRRGLAVAFTGAAALGLRLALLPFCPIPNPFLPNDFSFLLAADTFASGRLTNATPAMWKHFESIHITMQPTYMSMYFPAQGLVLAAGRLLFGHPWFGVLCTSALMCAAICWMLQAWLPPTWALLGGLLAVLRLGLFSYWINTYSGGGSVAALGGALVLGALPRFMRDAKLRDAILMATGAILLATTRPFEGVLLCIPVGAALLRWMLTGANRPTGAVLARRLALPVAMMIAAGAWMGWYNYRAFGSAKTLPYTVNRATYAMAPYFVWQAQRPEPVYRHAEMRRFYYVNELNDYAKIHSRSGFVVQTLLKVLTTVMFFAGVALAPPLFMLRRVLLDRRTRFLVVCVLVLMAGMIIEIFLIPHYLAPFTAVFYALGLQGMRHLRVWRPGGEPVGLGIVRLTVMLCVVLAGVRAGAKPLHLKLAQWPVSQWIDTWYGPGQFGAERVRIAKQLERLPGKQLVIVQYSADHNPFDEWVYNRADIDDAKVVWAQKMDAADDLELMQHYRDRRVWLVQPDAQPAEISPYTPAAQEAASLR
jgi:hypothetical protein